MGMLYRVYAIGLGIAQSTGNPATTQTGVGAESEPGASILLLTNSSMETDSVA